MLKNCEQDHKKTTILQCENDNQADWFVLVYSHCDVNEK